jgi:hypothetical protein
METTLFCRKAKRELFCLLTGDEGWSQFKGNKKRSLLNFLYSLEVRAFIVLMVHYFLMKGGANSKAIKSGVFLIFHIP